MMKKNLDLSIIILLFGVFNLISCSDFLETKPLTEYSDVDVWESADPNLIQSFLSEMYLEVEHGFEKYPTSVYVDEADARANTGILNTNSGGDSPTSGGYWHQWPKIYKEVRNCNIALKNLDRSPVDEILKARFRGEALFLRAMYYHQLLKLYGGVPLITEAYGLSDDFLVPRSSFSDCIEFIVKDCDEAAKLLPLSYSGSDLGRATKGAALALKSRVLIQAASDLHHNIAKIFPDYKNPELLGYTSGNQADRWKRAKQAAKDVMDLGIYDLYKKYPSSPEEAAKNCQNLFLSYGNEEDIFLRYFRPDWWQGVNTCPLQLYYPNGFGGRGNNAPLGNLVDAFEMMDGTPFDWNNPKHSINPYVNRDPRFYAFIIYNGSKVRDMGRDASLLTIDPTSTLQTGRYEKWDPETNSKTIIHGLDTRQSSVRPAEAGFTGYYIRKMMDPTIDGWFFAQDIPWRYFRYVEILFNYAESCIELGEDVEAQKYLNMIRKRAGMPDITDTGKTLLGRMRNEKRVEMMYEDQRYYDVRRWILGDYAYNDCYAADILYPLLNDKTTSKVPIITHKVFQKRRWNNKMYFRPIYHDEILRNELLMQNPDY
ncbi:MAG: RagB/SusD family nutrient uptake outer membrane protein [Bacteroidales bacterium]|nr:RagB/SusD family nutrient uptake outer membrane protein [Bacteroidales bacterium]